MLVENKLKIIIPKNPSIDLRRKPDIKKYKEQGFVSNTQLVIARHFSNLLNRGIYNDCILASKNQNLDMVLELCFHSPFHKGEPYRTDIFLPDYLGKNWCIEIDGFFHNSEEQKNKDKFKDEVAKRIYGFETIRQKIEIPDSLKYGHITNPKNKEYVKKRYENIWLLGQSQEILTKLKKYG